MTDSKLREICYDITYHSSQVYKSDYSFISSYTIQGELYIKMLNDITGETIEKSPCVNTWNNNECLDWIGQAFAKNRY